MKLSSSAAVLLGAAVVAFPGASAATVSLRGGIIPDKETSIEFINCVTKTDCPAYGPNTCERIVQQCPPGQCIQVGNLCAYGNRIVGPPRRPVVPLCSDFRNFNQCDRAGCTWDRGLCVTGVIRTGSVCSNFRNFNDCDRAGCFWDGGICRPDVIRRGPVCQDFGNARTCEFDGLCIWDRGFCVPARAVPIPTRVGGPCTSIFDKKQCKHKTDGACVWREPGNVCIPAFSEGEEEDLAKYEEEEEEQE